MIIEELKQWGFVTLAVVATGWSSLTALSITPTPPPEKSVSERTAHHPSPGSAEIGARNPFLTGTDWRAYLRARQEASARPAPRVSAYTPPPEPPPEVEGTMMEPYRQVMTPQGIFREGQSIGKWKVEEIREDRVVFSKDGKRTTVKL